jgi:hypothetical protein
LIAVGAILAFAVNVDTMSRMRPIVCRLTPEPDGGFSRRRTTVAPGEKTTTTTVDEP